MEVGGRVGQGVASSPEDIHFEISQRAAVEANRSLLNKLLLSFNI